MDLAYYTFSVVQGYSVFTVVGQVVAAVLVLCLITEYAWGARFHALSWVTKHALFLMLIVALAATLGSLFFSDIAGWNPCKDCWLQRIMMYPQVVLLAIALYRRDRQIGVYILALSLIGILIASDHYWDQLSAALWPPDAGGAGLVPCDTTGESCAKTQIHFTFGYITIPMMALTAFILNAIGSFLLMRKNGT